MASEVWKHTCSHWTVKVQKCSVNINMFFSISNVFKLKESKRAVNSIRSLVEEEDEEDDVEKVSWSGEPVGSKRTSYDAKCIISFFLCTERAL